METIPHPDDVIADARESAKCLKWRLAVLADCYAQRSDGAAAEEATLAFELLTRIDGCLDRLASGPRGNQKPYA